VSVVDRQSDGAVGELKQKALIFKD
jgi:hypothetical protein